MNKKWLLVGIGILAIIAASCKSKNADKEVVNTTDMQSEEDAAEDTTANTDAAGDNAVITDEADVTNPQSEEDAKQNQDENNTSDQNDEESKDKNYKNTYHDVDIKVPSIHED
ncbi:hypothetical protein [Lachnotalea glycerini]|uniref:Lipoprotein n=1 Tax=Lachnotalea glycerini TaxID=1763509 RepID=A0A371JBA8_9FIRM|nr:hypothetical protein [Lachnotalea glycerini]RDY29947.1 hypothetical protein CG710_017210 [Lachnotalea glycerini]